MVWVFSKNRSIDKFVFDGELESRITDFEIEEFDAELNSLRKDSVLDKTTNRSAVIKNPKPYVILLNFKLLFSKLLINYFGKVSNFR